MSKRNCVVSCPADTYSGYGARSRDFVKALIKSKPDWDVKILSQRWGNTRFGYLKDHKEDDLSSRIIPGLDTKPDVWVQITIPNEFQAVGNYNIGVTAAVETNLMHHSWVEGVNRMNLILASSKHSRDVIKSTQFEGRDKHTNQVVKVVKAETPVEVLFEGVDIDKYDPKHSVKSDVTTSLDSIKESFCYLLVGHWMQGDFGQDRKNVGYTIKSFLEHFKTKQNPPALILKCHTATTSIMDREKVLVKIDSIRKTVKGSRIPNIYLMHGEISDEQINELYNHPKVKVMVSHTKGEGFGRPLLEFTTTGKPIIASGWSGHTDFLDPELSTLIGGTLTNVHPSAAVKDLILPESSWFTPNDSDVSKAYKETFKRYKNKIVDAKKLKRRTLQNFTYDHMVVELENILKKHVVNMPQQINLTLPKLELPKLQKIDG